MKIEQIKRNDSKFPQILKEISDCPKQLYCIGNIKLLAQRAIGIVGSRKASDYGRGVTKKFAKLLAQNGYVVVSGLALGIDSVAHDATLEFEGSTIAVLGTSINEIYPNSNINLAKKILEKKGLIISEFAPGTPFGVYNFPLRNRIIAGLSEAVIVSEAADGSGSLITARLACEYNRRVFAVPQNINAYNSKGVNSLLREGAEILACEDDLQDYLGGKEDRDLKLNPVEAIVYESVKAGCASFDELAKNLKVDTNSLGMALVKLELNGLIRGQSGKYFVI